MNAEIERLRADVMFDRLTDKIVELEDENRRLKEEQDFTLQTTLKVDREQIAEIERLRTELRGFICEECLKPLGRKKIDVSSLREQLVFIVSISCIGSSDDIADAAQRALSLVADATG